MIKRTFVIGDIHGADKALKQVLDRAEITPDDRFIFLGDYVDGWSDSPAVIDRLITLNQSHCCLFIRGNHDALFTDWLDNKEENDLWLSHGGQSTVASYLRCPHQKIREHHQFFKNLKNYFIDDQNRLFLHAGFSKLSGPENEYNEYSFYWDRTLWELALATDPDLKRSDSRFPPRLVHFKEIFIGHTPVNSLGFEKPVKAITVWNMDTGAGFKGKLSMMEVNTKQLYQSDPVYKLYPHELGRN